MSSVTFSTQRQSQSHGGDSSPGTITARIQRTLGATPLEQLERIFSLAGEWCSGSDFDLMPMVIGGDEWTRIEAGLAQRVRIWNLFLRDIYSSQEILKAGIVPYEIVYADPNFHRGCARLPSVTANYLQLTAFDLQQDAGGQWLVAEDHLGVAEGASYAVKKRQVLRQVAPRLFDGMEILPVEDFAAQVMDVLQELVRVPDARAVLLAEGSDDEHYLDHAALARQMGVSIVQGGDLVVLDSRLYLKTIAGMEPVDVVLRRLSTSLLDPVTFDPSSRFGVPGLLSCVRKGSLTVANGLGSDLANNRALAARFPAVIEYYSGEKPMLQSPHVFELRDIDVREEVFDNRDSYAIRHAWKRGPSYEWAAKQMPGDEWNRFWQQVEAAPGEYVAHKIPTLPQHPCWTSVGAHNQPVTVRAFALGQNRISSSVLAWAGEASPLVQAADRVKDVWIMRSSPIPPIEIHAQAEEAPKRLRLTSRVAESFFWMGRYAERAEITTRVLGIVQMQPWPAFESTTARMRQPLWATMAAVTGHPPDFLLKAELDQLSPRDIPFYFLLDKQHAGSALSSLSSCRQNAENIREHFPPEVWSVLNHLYLEVALYADQTPADKMRMVLEDRSLHQDIIGQLDELTGVLEKHMLHNDAWHFWQLGVYAERSLMTILTLKQILAPEVGGMSGIGTNLDLLLQMLAGQYAYRSLYHARPVAARVARLLLQDRVFPRSALYCLEGMKRALIATFGESPAKDADTPLKHCNRVIGELNFIDMAAYFPRAEEMGSGIVGDDDLSATPAMEFSQKLTELTGLLRDFNVLISDHYLDHQVVLREPELFDPANPR